MVLFLALSLFACRSDDPNVSNPTDPGTPPTTAGTPSPFHAVPVDGRWLLPTLEGDAWVVRTTGSIPYIYAENRADLARVTGFALARDRYVMIDLIRRSLEAHEGRLEAATSGLKDTLGSLEAMQQELLLAQSKAQEVRHARNITRERIKRQEVRWCRFWGGWT